MGFYFTRDGLVMDDYGDVFVDNRRKVPGFTFKGGLAFSDAFTCGNYSTPQESPYGYGVHVVNGPTKEFKGDDISCVYDDRLRQWKGHAKWSRGLDRIRDKGLRGPGHKAWSYTPLPVISEFLSFMYGYKVECLQVLEGCNVGNGYPFLVFVTRRVHKPRKKKVA